MVVQIHDQNCDCPACEPYSQRQPTALTFHDLGWLSLAGAAVGSAIGFAIDPHGAWLALVDVVRSWGL